MTTFKFTSMFQSSTFKHLRFPFSFHLMPVFLFALSQTDNINWRNSTISFLILHLLIYPSSNGYNSYQDKDETSIGGIKNPPKVTRNLLYTSVLFDFAGVVGALAISFYFSACVLIYVLISRAYSYRGIRLKKYAIIGFLTVFIFQGGFTFLMATTGISNAIESTYFTSANIICMGIASLFIGSMYPLTQIYQHNADKKDGVTSISSKLGYVGTFIFSALCFVAAASLLIVYFDAKHQRVAVLLFFVCMLPVILRLSNWFGDVRKTNANANFESTMKMNLIASACMNLYFLLLILNNIYDWF